jgi:hypothetical protein
MLWISHDLKLTTANSYPFVTLKRKRSISTQHNHHENPRVRPSQYTRETCERLDGIRDKGMLQSRCIWQLLSLLLPQGYHCLEVPSIADPATNWDNWSRIPQKKIYTNDTYFCIIHHARRVHWILLAISLKSHHVREYDSWPATDGEGQEVENAARFIISRLGSNWHRNNWKYTREWSPIQQDGVSCGVFAIVRALYLAADIEVPRNLDPGLWSLILKSVLTLCAPEDSALTRKAKMFPSMGSSTDASPDIAHGELLRTWSQQVTSATAVVGALLEKFSQEAGVVGEKVTHAKKLVLQVEEMLPSMEAQCHGELGKPECSCAQESEEPIADTFSGAHRIYVQQHQRLQSSVSQYEAEADRVDPKYKGTSCAFQWLELKREQAQEEQKKYEERMRAWLKEQERKITEMQIFLARDELNA